MKDAYCVGELLVLRSVGYPTELLRQIVRVCYPSITEAKALRMLRASSAPRRPKKDELLFPAEIQDLIFQRLKPLRDYVKAGIGKRATRAAAKPTNFRQRFKYALNLLRHDPEKAKELITTLVQEAGKYQMREELKRFREEYYFWIMVDFDGPLHPELDTQCWEWKGRKRDGLGYTRKCTRARYACVLSWLLHYPNSPPDNETVVRHLCGNRGCVNPTHLSLHRLKGGRKDKYVCKGYNPKRGKDNPSHKLTTEQVLAIRRDHKSNTPGGLNSSELARKYGVSPELIRLIMTGRMWKHIEAHGEN